MEYRIYLRAEGRVSDCSQALLEFASRIDGHIPGMLRRRKHDGSPLILGLLEYWMSDEVRVTSGRPEDRLLTMLESYEPALTAAVSGLAVDFNAQIVVEYCKGEEPSGFFLDRPLLKLLVKIGATLDVDAVQIG